VADPSTTVAPATAPAARGKRFLLIPDGLMRLRGVPWAVKAVAARLYYRQQSHEAVKIGLRQLAADLGMTRNSAERAIHHAIRIGLVLAVPVIRGQRGTYDARPAGNPESVPIVTTPRRGTSGTKTRTLAGAESVPEVGAPSVPKAGAPRPHNGDTCGPEVRPRREKKCAKEKRREGPPPPGAHDAGNDGNGNGGLQEQQDPDAALAALAEAVRGRPLTEREATAFAQAVAEARAAGATDAAISDGVRKAGRDAPAWTGPNLARDAAGGKLAELLSSYQRAAHLPRPRTTLAEIAADVLYAQKCLARTPQPAPGDEGVALWNAQVAWADAHAADLPAGLRRPELVATGVSS